MAGNDEESSGHYDPRNVDDEEGSSGSGDGACKNIIYHWFSIISKFKFIRFLGVDTDLTSPEPELKQNEGSAFGYNFVTIQSLVLITLFLNFTPLH